MSSRQRARSAPVLAVAVLGVAVFGGGSLVAEPHAIAGKPLAAANQQADQAPDQQAGASWLRQASAPAAEKPGTPRKPAIPQARAPQPAPERGSVPAEDPQPQRTSVAPGQRPGTIVLAEGGTARLVRAEVGRDGELPIPDGVDQATWWGVGLGARSGATVFAGHVNWAGATGPFAELWSASRGDRVAVVDASGRTWAFRVQQVLTLSKHDLPRRAVELFGPTGKHRAVLVTCGGRWIGGSDGYESNRVVVATPVA